MTRRARALSRLWILPLPAYWLALLVASLLVSQLSSATGWLLPLLVLAGPPLHVLAIRRLSRSTAAQLDALAYQDDVTGLDNRRAFQRDMRRALAAGKAGSTGLVLFDVNGLKALNDQCGHQAGDELIASVPTHLSELPGRLYRIGGDEFALLVAQKEGRSAQAIARGIGAFMTRFESCGHRHEVRFTCGAATNQASDEFDDLFRRADTRLLQNKQALYGSGDLTDRRMGPLDRAVKATRERTSHIRAVK